MSENVYWRGKPNSLRLSPLSFLLKCLVASAFYFSYDEILIGYFPADYIASTVTIASLSMIFVLIPTFLTMVKARKRKEATEYAVTSHGIYKRVGDTIEMIHAASIDRIELSSFFGQKKDLIINYGMPSQELCLHSIDSPKEVQQLLYTIKTEALKEDRIPEDIASLISSGQDYYGVAGQSWYKAHNCDGAFELYLPIKAEGYFHLLRTADSEEDFSQEKGETEQNEMVYFKQRFEMTSPFSEFFKYFHKEEHRSAVLKTLEDGCVEVAMIQPGMDLDYLQGRGCDWEMPFLYIKLQSSESKPLSLESAVRMLKFLSESLPTNVAESELLLMQNTGRVSQLEKLADLSDTAASDLIEASKEQIQEVIKAKSPEELISKIEKNSQFPTSLSSFNDDEMALTAEPELVSAIQQSRVSKRKKAV